ncbi:TIGR01777 family oxidoreductase [Nocardioides astragali]|uniref:TIGR01777 family oxidoreductase n=1 Tax=Nocardioides astragali TaxID=1776736 RepID=A0ABW2MWK6_9ACTN|nr:TIGR01777 family oxidoreductase [Nocardioides astragali]
MRVVIAGASGFLGTHLTAQLRSHGHEVTPLVRREAREARESRWDPYAGVLDQTVVDSADVVVNVAGSPLFGNPHSSRYRQQLFESRIVTTRVLSEAVARAGGRPALLANNGTSYYGDHGSDVLTEDCESRGDALLTRLAREWQAATAPASEAGARVCVLRTAPVLDRASVTLKLLKGLFWCGLGARLGDGRQYFPLISLRDWVGAAVYLAESRDVSGVFNLCCPHTPTNLAFTEALAAALHRPAFLAAPAGVLRLGAGQMAPELLNSLNVRPAALERAGYDFEDEDVREVLAAALA